MWITQLEKDAEYHPVLGTLFTKEEKRQNWNKLKSPYVYEVPFFGDYVIHGIAKGCNKNILIFNTKPEASEAIHVIKASEFHGKLHFCGAGFYVVIPASFGNYYPYFGNAVLNV